ncbi:hypothetical protein H4R18_001315 [Coemansia javaensis]|uniref:Uncharacterized protein n=1 Tax=Coemansia javaensis TaxID=2761396 RepID=A0A9W8HIH0_9FUNG|nr:hypothetical protein H4R18_001315 [Coemansia javaensis]
MPQKLTGPLAKEAAMYREDLELLGRSRSCKLKCERLTTAIDALEMLAAVQRERDLLRRSAREDAARLADELLALERKNEKRLEMAKSNHNRAAERVRQIEREYAEPLAEAEAAVDRARRGVWDIDDASARGAAPDSADVSEDESLPPLTGPAASLDIDMARMLSQSLQDRKLVLIGRNSKKTFATTWNDGEQKVKAVAKIVLRSDTRQMLAMRREIAAY